MYYSIYWVSAPPNWPNTALPGWTLSVCTVLKQDPSVLAIITKQEIPLNMTPSVTGFTLSNMKLNSLTVWGKHLPKSKLKHYRHISTTSRPELFCSHFRHEIRDTSTQIYSSDDIKVSPSSYFWQALTLIRETLSRSCLHYPEHSVPRL